MRIANRLNDVSSVRANLYVYIRLAPNIQQPMIRVHLYTLKCGVSLNDDDAIAGEPCGEQYRRALERYAVYRQYRNVSVRFDLGGWVKFGVNKLLNQWIGEPDSNCGIVVDACDATGFSYAVMQPAANERTMVRDVGKLKACSVGYCKGEYVFSLFKYNFNLKFSFESFYITKLLLKIDTT